MAPVSASVMGTPDSVRRDGGREVKLPAIVRRVLAARGTENEDHVPRKVVLRSDPVNRPRPTNRTAAADSGARELHNRAFWDEHLHEVLQHKLRNEGWTGPARP